ncbi:MAG: hypothetical protein U9R47_10840 [Actinomycetota bacterium]|nr:hypothetical protein [Actinomycetota bacterium]
MRTVTVAIVIAATTILAACATTGQVEELERRNADLEQQATTTTVAAHQDVTGTVVTEIGATGIVCSIGNGDRIEEGDRIAIHDGSNATLAFDTLSDLIINDETCTLHFTFPDVPANEGFYRIRLGNISWSLNQVDLEENDWIVELDTRG